MYTVVVIRAALVSSLIYLADRLLAPRLPAFAATLVFPLAYAVELINTATNPLGSFGMTADTQYTNLVLLQWALVTGMWGIVFLMSWLVLLTDRVWEEGFAGPGVRRGIALYVSIMVLVLFFRQARLWFAQPPTGTVRVAGITGVDFRENHPAMLQAEQEAWEAFCRPAGERHDLYFAATIREARAGAQLVVWPEFSAPVAEADEPALIARGQEVARQEDIYLTLPISALYPDDRPYEQKMLLVDFRSRIRSVFPFQRRRLAMANEILTHRLARRDDLEALKTLMDAAISENQKAFLDESQIASSRAIMGLDTQLIDDGTYFIVEADGQLAGCGGWSRRATMYGGDQTPGRSAALLDPTKDAARIRAMYTHPNYTRKGIGRLIISLCEEAAKAEGFTKMELVATLSGEPLYRACGFEPYEEIVDDRGGVGVPLLRMRKSLT